MTLDSIQKMVDSSLTWAVDSICRHTGQVAGALRSSGCRSDANIPLAFLAMALGLAGFLPALVYSYSKDYVDDTRFRDSPSDERILSMSGFVLAVDLIMTQSMFLVGFSAVAGVILYALSTGMLTDPEASSHLATVYRLYSLVTIAGFLYVFLSSREKKLKSRWPWWWVYVCGWYALLALHIYKALHFAAMGTGVNASGSCWADRLVANSIVALVLAAVAWVVPLIHYKPLMGTLSDFLDKKGK